MTGLLHCDLEVKRREICESNSLRGRAPLQSQRPVKFVTLNARAVELIAKPGKSRQLRACIRQDVVEYLNQRTGFAGTFLLTSHKEPRLNMVLSFWRTEKEASENAWEESTAVQRLVSSLADVCRKVQTYEAALPDSPEEPFALIRGRFC